MSQPSTFAALPLKKELLSVLAELGFLELTPIQEKSIPLLLQGKDLIGRSSTGSGKTLAFALPLLNSLALEERETQGVVLCPTRELAVQVAREFRRLGRKFNGLTTALLVGGQPLRAQIGPLQQGAHIVVGTPGRVLDHVRRGSLTLESCRYFVLDEADRMLDMGFIEDMQAVLQTLPEKRQTLFFSATFPDEIFTISREFQTNPVQVQVEDEAASRPKIAEKYCVVDPEEKLEALLATLQTILSEATVVFCNLKVTVAEVADALVDAGVDADALHGDRTQEERDRIMAKFRNGSLRVLVATDVAARGLDVSSVDLVVNFDLPKPDIYVHRIGRTGRAGKTGTAVSLVSGREEKFLADRESIEKIDLASEDLSAPAGMASAMTTLFISGGRKQKVRPGDILGALTGEAGKLKGTDVGKIEVHDNFTYVAVSSNIAIIALERLRNGKIKGRKFRIELVR